MMEHTIKLPGTNLRLSPIGLGCTRAGTAWKGEKADRLLSYFIDHGGNVIDTARIYGLPFIGASETAIGQWIHHTHRRDDIVLMSKGGHPHVQSMHVSRMSQDDMRSDLEASLRALQTETIDVYFYHRDDTAQSVGELLERMEGFRREGKIRAYACSNWSAQRMQEADEYAHAHSLTGFVGNECLYNIGSSAAGKLLDDTMLKADDAMLAFHRGGTQNIMMPYSGLCEGFFHHLTKPGLLDGIKLKGSPYYTEANLRRVEKIQALQEKYHATLSQVLVGFFVTCDFPVLPLFGCSSVEHLAEIMAATEIPFTPEDYAL